MQLLVRVYAATMRLPASERFELARQMRRAAVSVVSNVAEGYGRRHSTERQQFLSIACGSAYELETQVEAAHRLGFISDGDAVVLEEQIARVEQLLHGSIRHA